MIDILGPKRVLVLSILSGFSALFLFIVYGSMVPNYEQKSNQLSAIQGQVSNLNFELNEVLRDFDLINAQKDDFQKLKSIGFMEKQKRGEAQEALQKILEETGVLSSKASIGRGEISDHPKLAETKYKLLKSPVKIEVAALKDADIYGYLAALKEALPGFIGITEFNVSRLNDVSRETLQAIISNKKPAMVSANITADWITLISDQDVLDQEKEEAQ